MKVRDCSSAVSISHGTRRPSRASALRSIRRATSNRSSIVKATIRPSGVIVTTSISSPLRGAISVPSLKRLKLHTRVAIQMHSTMRRGRLIWGLVCCVLSDRKRTHEHASNQPQREQPRHPSQHYALSTTRHSARSAMPGASRFHASEHRPPPDRPSRRVIQLCQALATAHSRSESSNGRRNRSNAPHRSTSGSGNSFDVTNHYLRCVRELAQA